MNVEIEDSYLVVMALRIVASDGGELTSAQLIHELTSVFPPDAEGRDAYVQQVRNLVGDHAATGRLLGDGYATYDPERDSIRITQAGLEYIARMPE